MKTKKVYTINNSMDVFKILNKAFGPSLMVEPGHRLISADFSSMYTNVPTKKALDLIQILWDAHVGANPNNLDREQKGLDHSVFCVQDGNFLSRWSLLQANKRAYNGFLIIFGYSCAYN